MSENLKIIFIVKERLVYGTKSVCYGLVNSCEFVVNKLREHGIESKVTQVPDYNHIDRVVHHYKPTHAFLEAIWVAPSKLEELAKLHPTIHWVVRIHSMVPFLVSEGMCFDWMNQYMALKEKGYKVSLSCNNIKLLKDLSAIYEDVTFTPNIYHPINKEEVCDFNILKSENVINVGCFGALRLLKNHAQQALWAIQLANEKNKILHFHVNVSEYESDQTSPVLNNLHKIFARTNHKLVEHRWMSHGQFAQLIKHMDFGLQISFTETFNIVAADFVDNFIPVIVSGEIDFIDSGLIVNPSNPNTVMEAMKFCLNKHQVRGTVLTNANLLKKHNESATKHWVSLIEKFRK